MKSPKSKISQHRFSLPSADKDLKAGADCLNSGRFPEAEKFYRKLLKRFPANPFVLHDLGQILFKLGQAEDAASMLLRAHSINPQFLQTPILLADVLASLDKHGKAREMLGIVLQQFPSQTSVCQKLVELNNQGGEHERSLELLEKFTAGSPDNTWGWNALGDAQLTCHRLSDALIAYEKSLSLDSRQYAVASAAADVALKLKDFGKSEEYLELALQAEPERKYNYLLAMGNLREKQLRHSEARELFLQANMLAANDLISSNRIHILDTLSANFDDADQRLRSDLLKLDNAVTKNFGYVLFGASISDCLSDKEIFAAHQAFDRSHSVAMEQRFSPRRHAASDGMRVGFVSGDFKSHPVAKFALPLIMGLSKHPVELFAYSNVALEDATTAKFKNYIPNWRPIRHLSDSQAAKRIADDQLDVLVDLSGHTDDNRLPVLQYRPAPIQCCYLGYTATTGLSCIDYWILDDIVFPKDSRESTSEKIYRLPRPWVAYPLNESVALPMPQRKTLNDPIIFGSANAQKKMSRTSFRLFADVLHSVPNSYLLLKNPQLGSADVVASTKANFATLGVNPERILPFSFSPNFTEHAAIVQQIDIALDTTPFSGGTTTCETLWMGVPVLTLTGDRFVSRMSSSMLAYLGLPEWTCATHEEFVAKAMLYSMDRDGLYEFRSTIRDRMRTSKLCDPVDLAEEMFKAFQKMAAAI